MNSKNGTIAVAFFLGAIAALGVARLAAPPAAAAQAPVNPVVAQRLNNLDRRLAALEGVAARTGPAGNTTGAAHPGGATGATSSAAGQNAQLNQDVILQQEVDTLKAQLAKLQTQFAGHYHTYTTETSTGGDHGVMTILQCQGYGKPCTSASSLNEITVFVPPTVQPTPQTYTIKTSGPIAPTN